MLNKNKYLKINSFLNEKDISRSKIDFSNTVNWFLQNGDESFFKNNIFVKFATVNLKNINKDINSFNFIATSFFVDKNYEIDLNNESSRNKLKSIYEGKILIVKINCDNFDKDVINSINFNNEEYIDIIEKINVLNMSNFETLNLNISELFMYRNSDNIPNILKLLKFSYKHNFELIFYFERIIWFKLVFGFAKYNIFISGGNSSKRHLLSYNHLILSTFLLCFDKNYIFNTKNNLNNDINFISNISKQKFIDSNYFKELNINNFNGVALDLFINYSYQLVISQYLEKFILVYISKFPYFLQLVTLPYNKLDTHSFINGNKHFIALDVGIEDSDNSRFISMVHPESYKYTLNFPNFTETDIPNYTFFNSMIEMYRNSISKKLKLLKLIYEYLPLFKNIDNKDRNKALKNLSKLSKQIVRIKNNNSKLLLYNSQDINKKNYSTLAYLNNNKRSFHTSNYAYNLNLDINYNNNLNEFPLIFNKKIVNTDLKNFISELYNNPLYIRLNQILKDENLRDPLLKQEQIENTLTFFWKKEIENLFKNKKNLFNSGYGISFIINAIIKLERDIYDLKNTKTALKGKIYKDYILLLNNGSIISIVLSNVLPNCIKNENLNLARVYEKVGKEIINEFFNQEWLKFKESKKDENNDLHKDNFIKSLKNNYPILSNEDYFKIGSDLIEFIADKTNLFKLINKKNEDNTVNRILMSDIDLEESILKIITFDNEKLPMICEPIKWEIQCKNNNFEINKTNLEKKLEIIKYGGYTLNKFNKISFIRQSYSNIGNTLFLNDYIIKSLNKLATVSYSLNFNVLNYLFELLNNNNKHILNIIKLKPHHKTKELYNLSLKHKWSEIHEIQKYNNQYYNDKSALQLAFLFFDWLKIKDNSIYFPFFIDWRGRFYTDTTNFSFQSNELARSLIVLKKGYLLNKSGLESLKVYTANCYGKNKLSYIDRIEWINSNLNNIFNMDPEFIFKAKEPLLFVACSFELKYYYLNKENFISTLPIYLDATCNGLQHLSSMVNETNLAKYVNILKSDKNELPNDVYTNMVEIINNNIKELIELKPEYSKLKLLNVTRDLVKRGIMTIPYGVTVRGISSQLQNDYFILLDPEKGKKRLFLLNDSNFIKTDTELHLTFKEIYKLAEIIYNVLYNSFPKLKFVVKYFKDMNKILKSLGLSTVWLTPAGMIIEQKYVKTTKIEIVSSILGKRKSITINKPDRDKINLIKQNSGIVPNIVHSLDASNVALLIKGLLDNNYDIDILTVHDCFGCQANNVDLMVLFVKLAFLCIYGKDNFLKMYHKFIIDYIIKSGYIINNNTVIDFKGKILNIPNIPKIGNNKLFKENILGSQYFIN